MYFFQESRPTLQSSPSIHVDKSDHHHKKSPLGEEFFCYESDEDDNDDDGMYTDGDGEKNDEIADVDGNGNGDGNEDEDNDLGLAMETNNSSKVIDASDVVIPNGGKRGGRPKAIQPPLNKRRRAG